MIVFTEGGINDLQAGNKQMNKSNQEDVQHIFLIGAKGIGFYGGYETFVYKLTEHHQNEGRIKYYVSCKANGQGCMDESVLEGVRRINDNEFEFHNAFCFKVKVKDGLGSAQALQYDIDSLKECIKIIKRDGIKYPIVYVMACRIGLVFGKYVNQIHRLGGNVYLNPDGHEWMRAKWNWLIRKYWKISERLMVNKADLVICDSLSIEKYIHFSYDSSLKKIRTAFIAYGCETRKSRLANDNKKFVDWMIEKGLKVNEYYLVVGRFVPENNYEIMIREFMKSNSKKKFAIITTKDKVFLEELDRKLKFKEDNRIKFVGTVYDQELLMKIRENAYGYFHGHEVGGTNPSLLEALGSTKINLLLDNCFNKEVAEDAAVYWSKEEGSLAKLIDKVDDLNPEKIEAYGQKAKKRIEEKYSWESICRKYADVFLL